MLVKIFSRDDCSFCSQAKQFLDGMEIEFEEEYQKHFGKPKEKID